MLRRIATGFMAAFLLSLAAFGQGQSYPPAWNPVGTYAVGDQVQLNGNIVRAIRPVNALGRFVYADWEMYYVRNNSTFLIGTQQTFATLQSAWSFFENCHIAQGATLRFYISTTHGDHSENLYQAISLDHPSGANISIVGDDPSRITFSVTQPKTNAFELHTGHSFGALSNLTISGATCGLFATGNSTIGSITGLHFKSCGTAIRAEMGANLNFGANVNISGFTLAGCEVYSGAVVSFLSGTFISGALSSGSTPLTAQYGFDVEFGGELFAQHSTIEDCTVCVFVHERGLAVIDYSTLQGYSTSFAALLDTSSHLSCEYARLSVPPGAALYVGSASTVDALNASLEGGTVVEPDSRVYTTTIDPGL